MKQLAGVFRSQLQLPLESRIVCPHPVEQTRHALIEALADLLREALGGEATEQLREQGEDDESEDHA